MGWLAGFVLVYVAVLGVVAWLSLHPFRTPIYLSPGSLGTSQEEVEFVSSDGVRLRAWWVPASGSRCVAVLAHGYYMNRAELVPTAFFLWQHGISCLLLDFRGHGSSGKAVSTMGPRESRDIAASVAFARSKVENARIVLIGSSMGSAASALALANDPGVADALILDSCYGRLDRAATGWWRFVGGKFLSWALAPATWVAAPFAKLNPIKIDIPSALSQVHGVPILVLHGSSDPLATPSEAKRVFDAIQGPKQIVWFDRCGHSEGRWLQPDRYKTAVIDFLRDNEFLECGKD